MPNDTNGEPLPPTLLVTKHDGDHECGPKIVLLTTRMGFTVKKPNKLRTIDL